MDNRVTRAMTLGGTPKLEVNEPTEETTPCQTNKSFTLTPFGGEDSLFSDFIERFTLISNALAWNDEQTCKYFPLYLKGPAFDIYLALETRIKTNWTELIGAFKRHYITGDSAKLCSREFRARRQLPSETAETFAYALRRLARKAYPVFNAAQLDVVLLDQFFIGLNNELQNALWDKDFVSFDSLVEKAKSLEFRKRLVTSTFPEITFGVTASTRVNPTENVLISERERVNNKGDYFCDNCKRYGHLTRSCSKLIKYENTSFNSYNPPIKITCFRCHEEGHKSNNCPLGEYNRQRFPKNAAGMSSETQRNIICFRCKRSGHKADACNANYDASGIQLLARKETIIPQIPSQTYRKFQPQTWDNKRNMLVTNSSLTEDTTIYDLESEVMELRTQLERLKDRNESSVNTVTEITFQQTKKHRKRNTSSKKRKIEILNKDETLIDNRGDNIQRESTVNNGIQANIFENPGHHFMDDSDKISSLGEKPFEDSIRDTLDFVTEDNDVPLELEYLVESPFYFENYYPVSPIPDSINVVTDNELESREGETHDDFFGNSGHQELGLKPLEFNSCDSPVVDNFDQDNLEMVTEFLNNESFGLNCSGNGVNDIETKDKFNIMDI